MAKHDNIVVKKDIIQHLSNKVGFSKKELTNMVDDILILMSYGLLSDKKLTINGFGTFEVKFKKARSVFNPKTAALNKILARNVITFCPSKKFRHYVSGKSGSHEE